MIKALIFDCFGVIITDALQAITSELARRDPSAAQQIGDIVKANNRGLIEPPESNRQIAAILGVPVEEFTGRVHSGEVKDEVLLDYVVQLRKTFKTALLSNIGTMSLHKRFSDQELDEHFDVVVVSGEIGYAKPEPEAYEHTAERLGVRFDECLFIDDREAYCEGARAVGMQAICYQTFEQFKTDLQKLLGHLA